MFYQNGKLNHFAFHSRNRHLHYQPWEINLVTRKIYVGNSIIGKMGFGAIY